MQITITVNGVDVTNLALLSETQITNDATQSTSTAAVTFLVPQGGARYGNAFYDVDSYVFDFQEWEEIVIVSVADGTRVFAGYISDVQRQDQQPHLKYVCQCVDYSIICDRTAINLQFDSVSDSTVFNTAITLLPTGFTSGGFATLVSSLSVDAKDTTVRAAFEAVCQLTGGEWRVDYNKALHYYDAGSTAAPFGFSDQPDNVSTFPYQLGSVKRDFGTAANSITVLGGMDQNGAEIRATSSDAGSIAKYGTLSATVVDRTVTDAATAQLRADAEVAQRAWPQLEASIVVYDKDGIALGQTVAVTSRQFALTGSYLVRTMVMNWLSNTQVKYTITVGQRLPNLVYVLRRMQKQAAGPTRIGTAPPPLLQVTNFASTLTPILIFNALPALPDPSISNDAVILLTTDRKLYRRNGNVWTKQVTAGDLDADSVTAGTIAAAAIRATDAVFAAGAIQTADIGDATINEAKIATTINVGGGSNRPGVINVLDAVQSVIAKIGDLGSGSYGVWGKVIGAGGTGYANAPFYTDTSGNVNLDGTRGGGSVSINGASFSTTLNGVKVVIQGLTVNGTTKVGIATQDSSTSEQIIVFPTGIAEYNASQKIAASLARNGSAGILKAFDGSGAGGLDANGLRASLDGSNGNVSCTGNVNTTAGAFQINGTTVIDSSRGGAFASIKIGGVSGINRSFNAVSSFSSFLLQYKDWSGVNQSVVLVSGITYDAVTATLGIVTA